MSFFNDFGIGANAAPTVDELEKQMASKDAPPPGVYHAVVDKVDPPGEKLNGWRVTYKIIAGPESGKVVEDVVWRPVGDDPNKDATTQKRAMLFGHRLGALVRGADGKLVDKPGHVGGLCGCVGAVCFIEVEAKERTWTDKKGGTHKVNDAVLTFNGLLKPDDKKVQGVPTAAGTVAAAAAAGAKANAAANPPATNAQFATL